MNHMEKHRQWDEWLRGAEPMDHKNAPPWQDIDIEAAQLPASPEKLRMVVDELDVVNAPRYRRTPAATFCNIFFTDVCRALGFAPGHWYDPASGAPVPQGKGEELSANKLADWMAKFGPKFSWAEADRQSAFSAAERGHLVAVVWKNPNPSRSGHVAVLLPEGTIAQAGATNFVGKTIREGFGTYEPKFYVQMRGASHQP